MTARLHCGKSRTTPFLGNLSGFFFNAMIGWIQATTGSYPLAMLPIAIVAAIGTVCVLVIGRHQPRTAAMAS